MTALVLAIFSASILGSLHCAGMCGAFLAIAVNTQPAVSRTRLQVMYHLGRLLTYSAFGALAGTLGALIDSGGILLGLQRSATILAGLTVVAFGLLLLARSAGLRASRFQPPDFLQSFLLWGHRASDSLPAPRRALFIGLLTAFLPCGWLWAFVITSAGTGNPALAALCMAVFWLGTLPVMVSLGAGIQSLSGALGRKAPFLTSCLLIIAGLWTLSGRWAIADVIHRDDARLLSTSHSADPVHSVDQIAQSRPSCCQDH